MPTVLSAVSLFSNCGAGDVGYRDAGFRFHLMAELDARRLCVCLQNHKGATGIEGDLRVTWRTVADTFRESEAVELSLLAACPPCQGMSTAKGKRGSGNDPDAGMKDTRNLLVRIIAQVAMEVCPKLIVVENVPQFLTRKVRNPSDNSPISAANLLIEELRKEYSAFPILLDLSEYGVPQIRRRAFVTFIKKDVPGLRRLIAEGRYPYPQPTHSESAPGNTPVTLNAALKEFGLPSLDAGSDERAGGHDDLHRVPVWSAERYAMVAAIPKNSGKGAWTNNVCSQCGNVTAGEEDAVCPRCLKPLLRPIVLDKETRQYRLIKGFRTSSYHRMFPNRPASTVTTASGHVGSDFTIHPYENRLLSTLECAKLQTFPDTFKWGRALSDWGHTFLREIIGEAVPPLFTQLHGRVLRGLLTNRWREALISADDPRCVLARRKLNLKDA